MEIQKEKILELLERIHHPETKESIVSSGMVSEVTYREGELWIGLQFGRANDPFIQSIKKACMRAVNGTFGEESLQKGHIQVLVPDPPPQREVLPHVKNIVAIAAGISDGLGYGTNTRAALVTRGLAEISRLGVAMGAEPLTCSGLGGLGDLVLTCTGDLSRNRTVGLKLGQGKNISTILSEMNMVAEGVMTTRSAWNLAGKMEVEMPILEQVYQVLYKDKPCSEAVKDLFARSLKLEQN